MFFIKNLFLYTAFLILFGGHAYAQGVFDLMPDSATAPKAEEEAPPVRIFLDPGHGGRDLGAMGGKFILEKNITLAITKGIKRSLADDERVEVVSSRFDDTEISVIERINMANKSGAALYVSVHADGARVPRKHPINLFISKSGEETGSETSANEWESINQKYFDESQSLAEETVKELGLLDPTREIKIIKSDKLLLGGLAMPALMMEPIDLSNPEDELSLDDPRYLNRIASAIGRGIINYLEKSGAVEISISELE